MRRLSFPDGRRFAFTVIDDTDVGTLANLRPLYALLGDLGIRTTKTVWPFRCPEATHSDFVDSDTLEDPAYRGWLLELQRRGFEITWHGATMESSTRERTAAALECFHETFGSYPRVHANHGANRENLYWGVDRFDVKFLRTLVGRLASGGPGFYQGHVENSRYWWGDLCARHIDYVRNLTCNSIDTLAFNPSMPYRDPARPLGSWWFSASDAEDVTAFNQLLSDRNIERLDRDGSVCIVATHFGKGFVTDGRVHPETEARLRALAERPGWFVPVGPLLDWLRAQQRGRELPRREWRRMQWRWAADVAVRKVRERMAPAG